MPDFRVAHTAPEHPKLRAAGLPAAGLWALAGAYAMRELTDGWVPEYWVLTWPAGKKHAATLLKVGLWLAQDRDGIAGYRFHDFGDYQRTAAEIDKERAEARARMKKIRDGSGKGAKKDGAAAEGSPDVRPNTGEMFGRTEPERSPNVHDSLALALALAQTPTPVGQSGASEQRASDEGARTGIPLPEPWRPHAGHVRTATHRGVDLEHEFAMFVAHAQAHGRLAVDWDAAFTVWLGSARRTTGGPSSQRPARSSTDANIQALIAAGEGPQLRAIGGGRC